MVASAESAIFKQVRNLKRSRKIQNIIISKIWNSYQVCLLLCKEKRMALKLNEFLL